MIDIGDKVKILQSKFISGLKHRKVHPVIGKVIYCSGEYIYVRPTHCVWDIEAYTCELEKI